MSAVNSAITNLSSPDPQISRSLKVYNRHVKQLERYVDRKDQNTLIDYMKRITQLESFVDRLFKQNTILQETLPFLTCRILEIEDIQDSIQFPRDKPISPEQEKEWEKYYTSYVYSIFRDGIKKKAPPYELKETAANQKTEYQHRIADLEEFGRKMYDENQRLMEAIELTASVNKLLDDEKRKEQLGITSLERQSTPEASLVLDKSQVVYEENTPVLAAPSEEKLPDFDTETIDKVLNEVKSSAQPPANPSLENSTDIFVREMLALVNGIRN
jgi:hypothetical protein